MNNKVADGNGIHATSHQQYRNNNNYEEMLRKQMDVNGTLDSYSQPQVHSQFLNHISNSDTVNKEYMENIAPYNPIDQLQAIDLKSPLAEPVELGQYYSYKTEPLLDRSYAPELAMPELYPNATKTSTQNNTNNMMNMMNEENMKILKDMAARLASLERDVEYLKTNQSPKVLGTNIHDIILFVLVGIFIIFVLDGIFRIGRMTI
jgi:hypothetical protein